MTNFLEVKGQGDWLVWWGWTVKNPMDTGLRVLAAAIFYFFLNNAKLWELLLIVWLSYFLHVEDWDHRTMHVDTQSGLV